MRAALCWLIITQCSVQLAELAKPKKHEVVFGPENVLKEKIVPELVDKQPEMLLEVNYPSGVKVQFGNLLKPTLVKDEPTFSWPAEPDQLYTIFMIDPDAPSRQDHKLRNVVHYLKNNIPGNQTSEGELAVEYVGACPYHNSGKHRMVFLLYKQNKAERIEFEELVDKNTIKGRGPLDMREYANENNLGNPVAINFYMSDWDPYSATIYSRFG